LEDEGQAIVDELKELNLGIEEEPCPLYISTALTANEQEQYFKLLYEYKDCLQRVTGKCMG